MMIQTPRLLIRPIVKEDWKSIQAIWQDFGKSKYAQYDMPHNTEDPDVRSRIAKWENANTGTDHMFFAVCLHEAVIGYIAFNKRPESYEIGYCFHSDHSGKGYARESHAALFDHVKKLGINRVSARTAIQNVPSVSLLKALNFHQIGTEKVSFYKDAKGQDILFDGGIFELDLE